MSRDALDFDLDALIGEARDELGEAIADELEVVTPDFPAIVEELARRGVAASDVAPQLTPRWGADAPTRCEADDPLASLLGEARQEIEADIAARRLLPVPDAAPATIVEARPRRLRWLGAALMIAAAVLLVWGLEPLLAQPLTQGAAPSAAQWAEQGEADGGQASARDDDDAAPSKARRRRPREHVQEDMEPASDDIVETEADAEAPDALEAEAEALETAETDAAAEAPARRRRPSLDALEAEAEALWRAGDRAGAERTLRTIIRRAGDSRRADLAYGDLFTITRQLYGREREAAVWREYLARFPRGDYADDARAGLCRREIDADAARCWSRYLTDFPGGLHRAEGTRATEAP
jgi:hypothetical protein